MEETSAASVDPSKRKRLRHHRVKKRPAHAVEEEAELDEQDHQVHCEEEDISINQGSEDTKAAERSAKKRVRAGDIDDAEENGTGEAQQPRRQSKTMRNKEQRQQLAEDQDKGTVAESKATGKAPQEKVSAVTDYKELKLNPHVVSAIEQDFKFEKLTGIQGRCIPAALSGRDLLAEAKTGAGKTLAFLIPIVEIISRSGFRPKNGTAAVIIGPTRELCLQIEGVLLKLLKHFNGSITFLCCIGGQSRNQESFKLVSGMMIVIASPGRLLDHLKLTTDWLTKHLLVLAVDEADRVLDNGFEEDMREIVSLLPRKRQTFLFSATQTTRVEQLARISFYHSPLFISMKRREDKATVDTLEQGFVICPSEDRLLVLYHFVKRNLKKKIIVFFSSRNSVSFHCELFNYIDVPCIAFHGKQKQHQRSATYMQFCNAPSGVLFTTDVAARGLDIPQVDWIVQFDPPDDPVKYVHRVGRTARAGRCGNALLFLLPQEKLFLKYLYDDANILVNEYTFDLSKVNDKVRDQLEELVNANYYLRTSARQAYEGYLLSYSSSQLKNVFNIHNLDLAEVAKGYGLSEPPPLKLDLSQSAAHMSKKSRHEFRRMKESKDKKRQTVNQETLNKRHKNISVEGERQFGCCCQVRRSTEGIEKSSPRIVVAPRGNTLRLIPAAVMKRSRTKRASAGQSPARRSLLQKPIGSQAPVEKEEASATGATGPCRSDSCGSGDENGNSGRSGRPRRRRRVERKGDNGVERALGFAYLRESRVSTESATSARNHPHQQRGNQPTYEKAQEKRFKRDLSPSRSSLPGPPSAKAFAVDEDNIKMASPRSAVSTTRGFSHLRESLSFALPRDVSYASRRRSAIIPLDTPLCPSAESAKVIALSGSRSTLSTLTRSDRTTGGVPRRRFISPPDDSARSLLSVESAMEHLNSTGSLGEVISSRDSLRSCPPRASLSMSTLGPLDLSPILREEHRPRRRHRSTLKHTTNGMPIDVPAAVITNTAHNGTVGANATRAGSAGNIRRHAARGLRACFCACLTMLFLGIWTVLTAPLFMQLDHPEYVFVRDYVDSLSEVQFIYEIPHASLRVNATEQLYLRVLSEATERVERAILPRKPPESDTAQQALYLRRVLRVYQAIQHRARLYARSRHRSRLHQYVIDPIHDVWTYGIMRHGLATTVRDLFWEPSWRHLWTRVKDVAVCLRQDEKMPCPTLTYRREEQHEADGIVVEPSVVRGSRAEIEHLRRLLEFVRQNSRRNNREYNQLHGGEVAGPFMQ